MRKFRGIFRVKQARGFPQLAFLNRCFVPTTQVGYVGFKPSLNTSSRPPCGRFGLPSPSQTLISLISSTVLSDGRFNHSEALLYLHVGSVRICSMRMGNSVISWTTIINTCLFNVQDNMILC